MAEFRAEPRSAADSKLDCNDVAVGIARVGYWLGWLVLVSLASGCVPVAVESVRVNPDQFHPDGSLSIGEVTAVGCTASRSGRHGNARGGSHLFS